MYSRANLSIGGPRSPDFEQSSFGSIDTTNASFQAYQSFQQLHMRIWSLGLLLLLKSCYIPVLLIPVARKKKDNRHEFLLGNEIFCLHLVLFT